MSRLSLEQIPALRQPVEVEDEYEAYAAVSIERVATLVNFPRLCGRWARAVEPKWNGRCSVVTTGVVHMTVTITTNRIATPAFEVWAA
jgi:hypothetical protein